MSNTCLNNFYSFDRDILRINFLLTSLNLALKDYILNKVLHHKVHSTMIRKNRSETIILMIILSALSITDGSAIN